MCVRIYVHLYLLSFQFIHSHSSMRSVLPITCTFILAHAHTYTNVCPVVLHCTCLNLYFVMLYSYSCWTKSKMCMIYNSTRTSSGDRKVTFVNDYFIVEHYKLFSEIANARILHVSNSWCKIYYSVMYFV